VKWIDLVQDREMEWAIVKTMMEKQFHASQERRYSMDLISKFF